VSLQFHALRKKTEGILSHAWYKPATPIAVMIQAAGKYAQYGASRTDRRIISINKIWRFRLYRSSARRYECSSNRFREDFFYTDNTLLSGLVIRHNLSRQNVFFKLRTAENRRRWRHRGNGGKALPFPPFPSYCTGEKRRFLHVENKFFGDEIMADAHASRRSEKRTMKPAAAITWRRRDRTWRNIFRSVVFPTLSAWR